MHCYKLCFTVQPGGSRKTEYYVLGTLDEVKAAALDDLNSPEGAYHALLYGETILLQCWEDGKKVASIDLHPFIRYTVRDRGRERVVTFPGEGDEPAPVDFDAPPEGGGDEDGEDGAAVDGEDDGEFFERLDDGRATAVATIDWDRVPVPQMKGAPLPEGAAVTLAGHEWEYGFFGEWDCYFDD